MKGDIEAVDNRWGSLNIWRRYNLLWDKRKDDPIAIKKEMC